MRINGHLPRHAEAPGNLSWICSISSCCAAPCVTPRKCCQNLRDHLLLLFAWDKSSASQKVSGSPYANPFWSLAQAQPTSNTIFEVSALGRSTGWHTRVFCRALTIPVPTHQLASFRVTLIKRLPFYGHCLLALVLSGVGKFSSPSSLHLLLALYFFMRLKRAVT